MSNVHPGRARDLAELILGDSAVVGVIWTPEHLRHFLAPIVLVLMLSVVLARRQDRDEWHGTAFYQLRNSAADANPNYFSPDEPASLFHRNRFGVAGGGALLKAKLFIFGDYQGVRQLLRFAGEFITRSLLRTLGTRPDSESTLPVEG
jgi:hypothetical protein